jgi:hypothetical protein
LVRSYPLEEADGGNPNDGVDDHGGCKEHKIDTGMFPFAICEFEQRKIAFQYPANAQADQYPSSPLPGGHRFKEPENDSMFKF